MAKEDPASWDVDTWQSVLDTMGEEAMEEEKYEEDNEVTSRGRM